jgi:ribulose-5-phosphate 4-epimerase/fuculose-1-phosphate aldolase
MNHSISMAGNGRIPDGVVRDRVSQEEWDSRVELAAAYRLISHFRMTDTIYNHISLKLPGAENTFLLNAFGLLYDEVSASNLVKVSIDGTIIDDPTGLGINRPGFILHSAIHRARPDIFCIIHTHTVAGIAVSTQEDGLLPISQHAAELVGRISYHDFEGIAVDPEEQSRIVDDLGSNGALILRNHGLLTADKSVGAAFQMMLRLERACAVQVAAASGGAPLRRISDASIRSTHATIDTIGGDYSRDWAAMLRLATRIDPGFAA